MKKLLLLLILWSFLSEGLSAQNLTFYGVLPAWSQTGRITKKLNYNFFASTTIDAFDRTIEGIAYPATDFQLYLQPSLIYVYSPNLNFAGSYTYQRNNPFRDNFSNEHRLWEQVIYSLAAGNGKITNRFRLEQRFIQNRTTEKYPLATRFRFQLGFNRPLQGQTLDENEFYLNAYNEFYFSLTGTKNATYSENWTYAGIGYSLKGNKKLELGYLFQASVRNPQQDRRYLQLAQVSFITNFNFFQKETE